MIRNRMQDFNYACPTRMLFGRAARLSLARVLARQGYRRVLVVYGQDNARKRALLTEIGQTLSDAGLVFESVAGARSNPTLTHAMAVSEVARRFQADVLLAVGGGSVIDTAKAAAAAYYAKGEPWAFFTQGTPIEKALPVATILTLPAAGSEQSIRMVINHRGRKLGCASEAIRPAVSVLDPELFVTIPAYQIASGVVDMISHIMERYFTNTPEVEFTSVQAEAVMRLAMKRGVALMDNPNNLTAWSDIALIGAWAHNGFYGLGHEEDWACHAIEHELSALDPTITHGAALACLIPAWMQTVLPINPSRIERFAREVMGCESAQEGIDALRAFYARLKMPQNLQAFSLTEADLVQCTERLTKTAPIGHYVALDKTRIAQIYERAFKGI